MKSTFLIATLVCCLCLSTMAFGQDLTDIRMLGRLVPHSPEVTEKVRSSVLIYKNRGILFHVSRPEEAILSTAIFQPAAPLPSSAYFTGTVNVVPGVGAYGAALGMVKEQLDISPYLKNSRKMFDDPKGLGYDLGRPRMLIVTLKDGKASQMAVLGPFVTAEGITERSSDAQIEAAYGQPDEYYDVEWQYNPHPWVGAMFILPLIGLLTGLYLRHTRSRMDDTPSRLTWLVLVGALGLSIANVAFLKAFLVPTGMDLVSSMVLYAVASGILIGGGSVLVLELLPRHLPGLFGAIATLALMLVVALIASHIVKAVEHSPMGSPALYDLVWLKGPFIVTMFFGAGVKRPE